MKRPWLAATLNLIPGIGYLYLDFKRLFGWLLLGMSVSFVISLFDPSLNNPGQPSQGIWNLWTALFILLPYLAFIIDGYFEAKNVNELKAGLRDEKPRSDNADLPKGAIISPINFVILSIITFNLYETYWSWKMWKTVQQSGESKSNNAWLLAIFNRFSNFSLFTHLQKLAEEQGHKTRYPVWPLALIFLIVSIIANDRYASFIIILICIIILAITPLPLVKMQNEYMLKTKGKFAPTKANWWLIMFLVVSFIIGALVFSNFSS